MVRVTHIHRDGNIVSLQIEVITGGNPVYVMEIDVKSREIRRCTAPKAHYNFFCTKVFHHIMNIIDAGEELPENFVLGFY